jgi:hypothetical protein
METLPTLPTPGPSLLDEVGKRYGKLVVLSFKGYRSRGRRPKSAAMFEFLCDCGNICIRNLYLIRWRNTGSCGCLVRETMSRIGKSQTIHGLSDTPEHISWVMMKDRCLNPKNKCYKDYGGRGITVYTPWIENFKLFLEYMGQKPGSKYSLDRIDNSKGYEPGNVRWATPMEQANNKRCNVFIEHNGLRMTKPQWDRFLGFRIGTIQNRIGRSGWSFDKAVSTPVSTVGGKLSAGVSSIN